MNDPNELLKIARDPMNGFLACMDAFDALDQECKKGNLPEEWAKHAVKAVFELIRIKDRRLSDMATELDERRKAMAAQGR